MPKIVIYTDFDGTLTRRVGQKTFHSEFYKSLLLQPGKEWSLKPVNEVQSLFVKKFGEYNSDFNYKKRDSDFLLSLEAVTFLKELLNTAQVDINIITKNTRDYVLAVLKYQGFSQEELEKIIILDSCDKYTDVKNSVEALQLPQKPMPAYIFDDSKNDMSRMKNAFNQEHFDVSTYSEKPGKFRWMDYLNEIKAKLILISDNEVLSLSNHEEISPVPAPHFPQNQENEKGAGEGITSQKQHLSFWRVSNSHVPILSFFSNEFEKKTSEIDSESYGNIADSGGPGGS
jgi:hypothetical protein